LTSNADQDPAFPFNTNADPDPASKNNANLDPQPWFQCHTDRGSTGYSLTFQKGDQALMWLPMARLTSGRLADSMNQPTEMSTTSYKENIFRN
jgi:hypothetical protein